MRWSEIDKRARRTVPKQCVSDHGMHKDADNVVAFKPRVADKGTSVTHMPLREELILVTRRWLSGRGPF